MNTFKALSKMEYIISKRSLSAFVMGIGLPVAFFLLFSSIGMADVPKDIQAEITKGILMSMTTFSSISFAFFSLPFTFQEDRTDNRLKMIEHSPIPIWQYYLVTILRIVIYFMIAIAAVFAVGHFVKGVTMPLGEWLGAAGLLVLGASCLMPFGLLLSFIKSAELLSVVANLFYMAMAVLGGLWMPISSFPDFMQSFSKLTPTYHVLNMINSFLADDFAYKSLFILLGYAVVIFAIGLAIKKKVEVR